MPRSPSRLLALGILALASGCTSPPDSAGTDTSSTDSDTADTAADTTDSGIDTAYSPERVLVHFSVWTPETNCWASVYEKLDARYWWPYAEDSVVDCGDMAWSMPGGDRCIHLSRYCTQSSPRNDPEFASTPEQEAVCLEVEAQTAKRKIQGCQ